MGSGKVEWKEVVKEGELLTMEKQGIWWWDLVDN